MVLPKMLDKILKIQYFTIRQLPSQKPLPAVVLAKNERIRDRLERAHPIPVGTPGIEMLTPAGLSRRPHPAQRAPQSLGRKQKKN